MNDIHVEPNALNLSADGMQGVAEHMGRAGHWLDDSFTAASTLNGWESGAALRDCADAWQTHMLGTVRQLQEYADKLRQSAHSYTTAEQESTRRISAALADLGSREA
ncbi:type VII secretion target [Kitasatospora sp. YST-16]|uniref:type VII secretion target n=1 Tax=Kitasatospora sp. YST-16 TaxID=2998080 RepID=UPI00228529A0|nr:type VII secretion target [Kitasatospora sp. YST-16]WAL71132.1 type VII secretion target [Kitasatospora sp. YST-16]WNW37169.1 type VII secretion target [Streptomyces sp. Li-HN-5-13]